MSDLAVFALHLRPERMGTVPAWLGRAVQAWYLDQLRQVSPALSAAVHDGSRLRPFTLSTLLPVTRAEMLQLNPSRALQLRITTLHTDVTQLTLNGLLPRWLSEGIVLHGQPFRVESVDTQTTRYAELMADVEHVRSPHPRSQAFDFQSPTVFNRTGGIQVPLPLPEYVFGSLIDRWQAFTDVPLHADLRVFVQECVSIERCDIRTQYVSLERANRGYHTGFVGRVTFRAQSGEAPLLAQWHLLGLFAPYSGVGKHVVIGMGQMQRVFIERKHSTERNRVHVNGVSGDLGPAS